MNITISIDIESSGGGRVPYDLLQISDSDMALMISATDILIAEE